MSDEGRYYSARRREVDYENVILKQRIEVGRSKLRYCILFLQTNAQRKAD